MTKPESLRHRLRLETKDAHDALDATLGIAAQPPTRSEYARLLGRFHGFHQRIEPCLAQHLGPRLLEGRSKLQALQSDLEACGMPVTVRTALPLADGLPPIHDRATALGLFYVSEGSTLGGRFIARLAKENPAIPTEACRYFDIYGEATSAMWRTVCDALNAPESLARAAATIDVANKTFAALSKWLAPEYWRNPLPANIDDRAVGATGFEPVTPTMSR